MRMKCAVFDFDGTLFDSMFIWDTVGETYLRCLGKEPKPSLREVLKAMSLYQAASYFQKEYGVALSAAEIIEGINRTVERFYVHEALPKPGVIEFLRKMKRYEIPMCIATATDRRLIEAALKRCGMEQYFDTIFTCGEVGHGKDEPIIYRRAMEHFHGERHTTFVFEDAVHAVRTASADGFAVVAVYDDSEKEQAEMKKRSDCYLADFKHTENFWKLALSE